MACLGAREGREPRPERGGAGAGTRGTPVPSGVGSPPSPRPDLQPCCAAIPGPRAQSSGGSPSCLLVQLGALQPSLPAAWLPAPGSLSSQPPPTSLGLFPLLPPTSSRQVPNCRPGLGLSGRGACSCQSQKYSLMTQLEDKSPDWLLQAKYRAGGTTCPRPRAPAPGLPSHVGLNSCWG